MFTISLSIPYKDPYVFRKTVYSLFNDKLFIKQFLITVSSVGKDLITLLNKYLSKQNYRNKMAGKAIGNLITKHDLKRKVDAISKQINNLQKNKSSNRTKITNKIVTLIKSHKKISLKELLGKKYLNWNYSMKFDAYRKTILNTKGITEVGINSKSKKYEWKSVYTYKEL